MSDSEDIKMRVAVGGNGHDSNISGSPGPSSSTAQYATDYSRKLAQREYGRNMRFARQFREFATAGTPRTPLRVHVEGSGDGAEGINAKLLPAESAQAGAGISAAGAEPFRRDPGQLSNFLDHSQAQRSHDSIQRTRQRVRMIIMATMTLSLAAAAAAVAWHDGSIDGFHAWLGVPLVSWLIFSAAAAPAVLLARHLMALLVRLLESAAAFCGFPNVHYVLIGVTDALKLVATVAVLELLVVGIITGRGHDFAAPMLRQVGACVVVLAAVELFKTLSCRLLSLRVNSGNLFDMLQDAINKEVTMNRLMARRHVSDASCTPERTAAISQCRGIPEWAVQPYLNDLYALAKASDQNRVTFTDYLSDLGNRFKNMTEGEARESASHTAEYFWLTLRGDPSRDHLTRDDLLRVLQDEAATDYVFSAFDIDGDGFVDEHELHFRLQKCFEQRRNVALTLVDNDEVIQTLEMLVGAALHVLAFFVYLYILGVDVRHLLISLSSVGLAFVFVFGNNLRVVYESVVFLFMIRPYQVGDCVRCHGELHWVKNFGLLTTQFTRMDGCRVSIPNETLMKAEITNLSQSGNLRVRTHFEVDTAGVSPELCEELASQLLEMMEEPRNAHLFCTAFPPLCHIEHVTDPLKYKVGLCYQLAASGEQFVKVWEANSRVNYTVGLWLEAHHLEHSTSIQPLYSYSKRKTQ